MLAIQPVQLQVAGAGLLPWYVLRGCRDESVAARRIMFPAGSINGFIQSTTFEVLNDDIDEYVEGFILVLDVDTSRTAIVVNFSPSKRTALVNIYDDDYSKCCACNIHVTGDSMHVVTLHACSSNVTCTVLLHACWIHVSYTCNTHVT